MGSYMGNVATPPVLPKHSFRIILVTHTILRLLCFFFLSIERRVAAGTCTKNATARAGASAGGDPGLPPSRGAALGKALGGFWEPQFLLCKTSISIEKVGEVSD